MSPAPELLELIAERDRLVREVLRAEERRQLAECKDLLDRFTAETVAWRILKSMDKANE